MRDMRHVTHMDESRVRVYVKNLSVHSALFSVCRALLSCVELFWNVDRALLSVCLMFM